MSPSDARRLSRREGGAFQSKEQHRHRYRRHFVIFPLSDEKPTIQPVAAVQCVWGRGQSQGVSLEVGTSR